MLSCNDFKSTARKLAGQVLVGNWENVPVDVKSKLLDVFPANVEKSVAKNLGKYVPQCHIENVPGDERRCKKELGRCISFQLGQAMCPVRKL